MTEGTHWWTMDSDEIDASQLVVPPSDLGPNWSVVPGSVQQCRRPDHPAWPTFLDYSVRFRSAADYPSPTTASVSVSVFADSEAAQGAFFLLTPMGALLNPGARLEQLPIGDGQGVTFRFQGGDETVVGYAFAVSDRAAAVWVSSASAPESDLRAQALRLASVQEERFRSNTGRIVVGGPSLTGYVVGFGTAPGVALIARLAALDPASQEDVAALARVVARRLGLEEDEGEQADEEAMQREEPAAEEQP